MTGTTGSIASDATPASTGRLRFSRGDAELSITASTVPVRLFPSAILAALAAAIAPGVASASVAAPRITSLRPARLAIGQRLVINGRGFLAGRGKNLVIFQRSGVRAVFVKADSASTTRVVVTLPAYKLLPFLRSRQGQAQPTSFTVRVLARLLSPASRTKVSVTPATPGGNGPAIPPPSVPACSPDFTPGSTKDSDHDGLPDVLEHKLHTDPCNADTDGDGVPDGYEYYAALDLNSAAQPYPGKRAYPNPLDPTDASTDHDGDGLTMAEEYAAWARYGDGQFPLTSYSDGNQNTGGFMAVPPGKEYLDLNHNGVLSDDERDVDGDGIGNWDELHGAFDVTHAKNLNYKPGLDWLDPDTDGDGIPDGADDQDHDGVSNLDEIKPPLSGTGYTIPGRVAAMSSNPLDPCDPDPQSVYCPLHPSS